MRYYQIGEAAELTGLSRDTLRFYEKKGLIRSERKENGYRLYNENDLAALISIKYRRHMNHSIGDIEKDLIGANFSIENMKNLTEAAIIKEQQELRKHQLSMKRLELTKRDIASIEAHMGRCSEKCFPKIYEGEPRPSYMEAIRSWFTLASEKDGLDMCYLLDSYSLKGEELEYRNTRLIFFAGLDAELEQELDPAGFKSSGLSGRKCLFTVAECQADSMPGEAAGLLLEQKTRLQEREAEGIIAPGDGKEPLPGRRIRPQDKAAEEIFAISLIDSYRDEIHTRYQEIYMPI